MGRGDPNFSPTEPSNSLGVSIITVVLDDVEGLRRTFDSVSRQSWSPTQWVLIDGASTDGTAELAQQIGVESLVSVIVVSQRDRGIYDAMNHGLRLAIHPWIIFMNGGDRFASSTSLASAMRSAVGDFDVLYSDVVLQRGRIIQRVNCDFASRRFHHQAIIYRRCLHDQHGDYLVAPGVTISDYLFFNLLTDHRWVKVADPIAVCDATGRSSKPSAYYQKLAVDLIFGRTGRARTGLMLLAYPIYRLVIRPMVRFKSRMIRR